MPMPGRLLIAPFAALLFGLGACVDLSIEPCGHSSDPVGTNEPGRPVKRAA
jgi:hypothetical protein